MVNILGCQFKDSAFEMGMVFVPDVHQFLSEKQTTYRPNENQGNTTAVISRENSSMVISDSSFFNLNYG